MGAEDEVALEGLDVGGAEVGAGVVEVATSPHHLVLTNLMLIWMHGNRQVCVYEYQNFTFLYD